MGIGKEISEARKIAQVPRFALGMDWYRAHFTRSFSIYLSYFLAKVRTPPNVITIAMGITSLCGAACMVPHNLWWNIAGAFLGQLWLTLDCTDGEVARLLKRTSVFGKYLDNLTHTIANPAFVLALGLHVYLKEPSVVNLAAMILIYSTRHWQRGIGRLTRITSDAKSAVRMTNSQEMSQNSICRTGLRYLRTILLHCFGDVEAMLIVSAVILLSHTTERNIAKWVLYLYTISSALFITALIVRDRQRIRQEDSKEKLV